MDLDPHANADLTAFFMKRFPAAGDRAVIAHDARVTFREPPSADPEVAWGGLLTRAREQSALPRLAHCAARRLPTDENLQGVAAILSGRQWPPPPRRRVPVLWKQVGALSALVAIAGVAWAARGPASAEPGHDDALAVEQLEAAPAAERPAAVAAPTPAVEVEPPPAAPATDTVEPALGAAAVAPPPAAPSAPRTGSAEPPPATTGSAPATGVPSSTGSCRGPKGALVGYWYAGTTPPGKKGDQITVPRDLNVRADYPDRHNNYDRRADIRCTLGVGQSLVLTADPIAVPGGAYWVPLHAARP